MVGTPSIGLVEVFLAVAGAKSFSIAATRLRMPKSSVSRWTARLEAELGVQLFHRTTHSVVLSPAGEALLSRVGTHFASLKDALINLPGQSVEPSGKLRITAPADFAVTVLHHVITSYSATFSKVQVETVVDSRPVDLVREGFDMAIRAHRQPLKDSTTQIRRLTAIHFGFFASRSYVEGRGTPRVLGDAKHVWVGTRTKPFEVEFGPVEPHLASEDFLFTRELIRDGAGIGLLPGFAAAADISAGTLVKVLPRIVVKPAGLSLLFPRSRHTAASAVAFRKHLIEYLAKNPLMG
jgi:DNA-binding transcriptional LysR family regulator